MTSIYKKIEFFIFPNGEVWYTHPDNEVSRYEPTNKELTDYIFGLITDLYPDALKALSKEYESSKLNILYFKYRIVSRFVRCNFAEHDSLKWDIEEDGHLSIEEVRCPLRGECKFEGIVCKPKIKTKLSDRELEVARLISKGYERISIAEELKISPYTVNRHIANIKARLSINKTVEIVSWFKDRKFE